MSLRNMIVYSASLTLIVSLAAAFAGGEKAASARPAAKEERRGMQPARLEHLFDVELQYKGDVEYAPLGEKEGKLLGGGDGTVKGDKIRGKVLRWSNFEHTLQEGVCTIQIPAEIVTEDGAKIRFEGRGHAIVPDKARPSKWRSVTALRFQTEDKRYEWLNSVLAIWDGDFDMETGLLRARVYARGGELGGGQRGGS